MSRVRVNYKSDLPPIGIAFMLGDHEIPVPTTDFVIRFFVEGSPGLCFECLHKGEEYINCEVTDEDTLTCYINNHGFCCGRLCCEFIDLSRNVKYADGVQKTVTPTKLNIVLVEGAGDDLVEITESIAIDIETVIGEIREAMEKLDEYADIIAALQAAVLTIPDVIDDLETGGHTDALSAEQGKILKEILDNLGRISVDGIKGFTPISSLNDLPLNPTTEQKRQAYIFENALYVYVGAGGDTLGGKYQSVELVSLDWGDKSYNASEFSGLGRRWLKKNMVEGVNVLTSAMIGTANTEYFIQYDYDLDGATVTLPANASLVFMGGSIKNGILVGNNTRIVAKKGVMIFDNITIQGTWDVADAYSSWFKMHKKGYKIKSVTENGTTIGGTNYATFRVEGYNADSTIDYVAAPSSVAGTFNASGYEQYDDTASLQSLLDIRAKKTIIEDGIYIIKADTNYINNKYSGIFIDNHKDSEIVLEGVLKVYPNSLQSYNALDVIGCENLRITGKGGIQGDLLDHTGANPNPPTFYSEWGMNIAVANTKNLVVEDITTAYAWGDCIYSHWNNGATRTPRTGDYKIDNKLQENHTFKNVSIIYGGRTGYGCELADNVVFDSCYFYGTGRVRGKATNSAVDVEPFNYADTPQRYVMNYEFKNNVFKNSANGLRLERCVNCSVHDNYFDYGWNGILVISHTDVSYDITSPNDRGWIKSRMSIYNNHIKSCTTGINLGYGSYTNENIDISSNTCISCERPIGTSQTVESLGYYPKYIDCKIHDNITYGCGQWVFDKMINCEIYNNRSYGCRMPELTNTWGNGNLIKFSNFDECSNTKFYGNMFSLDYGKSIYGLGEYGKEEIYHGLPVGFRYTLMMGATLTAPDKVHFHDNEMCDDFVVYWGRSYGDFENNAYFRGGVCSVRNENSEVFLENDTFRSVTYGDEGIVTVGGIISCSWLKTEAEGGIVREFEPYMEVAYGEIIKLDTRFAVCNKAGTCGATLELGQGECGTARFLTKNPYLPDTYSANNIKISFKTRGICTSQTRPDSFLYAGRKMWETDTNKEIVYNGSSWVYNDIYTEE